MTEASELAESERDLPVVFEEIRAQLVAQVSEDWHKVRVKGSLSEQRATHECSYQLRGNEQSMPLAVADAEQMNAAVAELFDRMRAELSLSFRTITLEFDADVRYSVNVSTS